MNRTEFEALIAPVAAATEGQALDDALAALLNEQFPPEGATFRAIEAACHAAIEAGWMCTEGGPGRRFGRVIEPCAQTRDLSVDVVDLTDVVGPHHRHPNGEICMVMPQAPDARFDGHARGWCVYAPQTEHFPTVTGGQALVLYMLPGGRIDFTGRTAE